MLVSIGIPTYNRVAGLARAVDSALAQTHDELELIISDNASDDGTEALCLELAARDRRVRYVRHPRNQGPTANFNYLFTACRGEYVLMLADDDWLDASYVATCLEVLRAESGTALVAGRPRYQRDGAPAGDGTVHRHLEPDPGARVVAYLRTVQDNGVFYGVMPRAVLVRAGPLPNVLGNDWLLLARIAAQGAIRTLDEVHVHRELGGTSVDIASILETFEVSAWQQRVPQLVIAAHVLRDVLSHPQYRALGARRRFALAVCAALASLRWRHLAWHLVTPAVAQVAGRRRGRWLWERYLRLTRSLGAGRQAG